MNKAELLSAMANLSGLSKTDSEKALDSFVKAVTNAVASGDQVRLVGFGTFYSFERQATVGRNPKTGEPLKIPASKQAKFKAGKALKEAVNK